MLSPGEKRGRYEIVAPLGAGGMGEVYRARDAELQREVALKILPPEVSSDPDRGRRFEREARAVAAVSHPNVLTVFDVGRSDGQVYLVFEMLEGSTLAEVTKRGALCPRDALDYAMQIARGLAAVHARGLVHRDLKPANLFLTTAGVVKIIDFGLARTAAASQRPEESTAKLTDPGMPLGTVSYMSPEQSQGLPIDARSDIFSLGTVLYEMLTGWHPFKRDSTAGTLASILRDEPPAIGPIDGRDVEPVAQLVGRCLAKKPEDRFHSANDLALALELLKRSDLPAWAPRSASAGPGVARPARRPQRRSSRATLAAAPVLAIAALAIAWLMRRPALPPPRLEPFTAMTGSETNPTFSPDGEQVAFEWGGEKSDNSDIYIKIVGSPEVRRLTTSPLSDWRPSWSPDGRQIAFTRFTPPSTARIHVISPLGGADRKLSDATAGYGPVAWTPDGRWVVTGATFAAIMANAPRDGGLRLIRVDDGEVRVMTSPVPPAYHANPTFSPDGRHLAYLSCLNLTACFVELAEVGADAQLAGPARRLTRKPFFPVGGSSLAWTRDGSSLLFPAGALGRLFRVGTTGSRDPEPIDLAGYNVAHVATAAHRDRLVFDRQLSRQSIVRFAPGGSAEAIMTSTFGDRLPDYSPDGERIAFESRRGGERNEIWVAGADGSNPTPLTHGPGLWEGSPRWSPDGRTIAFDSQGEDGNWDVWTIESSGGPPRRITTDPAPDNLPSWSRDGRFLYWASNRTGAVGIWRVPVAGGPEERVTETPGFSQETADGKALLFSHSMAPQSALRSVALDGGAARVVLECVPIRGFASAPEGLYHLGCAPPGARTPLYLQDLATGRDRLLGELEGFDIGLAVAPAGRSILYSSVKGEGTDLQLIDDFR